MSELRTPDEAFQQFQTVVGSVVACVTAERIAARPYVSASGRAQSIFLPHPTPLRAFDGGRSGLHIEFQIAVVVREGAGLERGWRVETAAYAYRLLDNDHRELLVYHWQPHAMGPIYPHLHVSASLNAQVDALTRREIDLDKRHLATGPVSLAEFVRMLITEFEIRPLRPDRRERLDLVPTH